MFLGAIIGIFSAKLLKLPAAGSSLVFTSQTSDGINHLV